MIINKKTFAGYFQGIWASRYFWTHLALSDLRARFRRSKLGILWAILNPLLLTLLLSFVMGTLFHHSIGSYAPYVFSGIIIWTLIVDSGVQGCHSLIVAEGYIKQFSHPAIIYPLRTVLINMFMFGFGFMGLFIWVLLWRPSNLNISLISLIPTFILYFLAAWPLAIITGFINSQFRDFVQVLVLVFQALWYTSPVFISAETFVNAHLGFLVHYNPIYHVLNLVRAPMLYGRMPTLIDYSAIIIVAMIFWIVAIIRIKHYEDNIIFAL